MEKRSKKDIIEYLAINHDYETLEELAENCGIAPTACRYLLKKNNLKLLSHAEAKEIVIKEKDALLKKIQFPINKYRSMLINAEREEKLHEQINCHSERPQVKREPGIYDQQGSPYGIADQLRGINIKR